MAPRALDTVHMWPDGGSSVPSPSEPSGEDPFTTYVSHSMEVVEEDPSIVFVPCPLWDVFTRAPDVPEGRKEGTPVP